LDEIVTTPEATAETIAQREGCSPREINMTISLAFLSPALVKTALDDRLPPAIGAGSAICRRIGRVSTRRSPQPAKSRHVEPVSA
jgi:hypothetical protein